MIFFIGAIIILNIFFGLIKLKPVIKKKLGIVYAEQWDDKIIAVADKDDVNFPEETELIDKIDEIYNDLKNNEILREIDLPENISITSVIPVNGYLWISYKYFNIDISTDAKYCLSILNIESEEIKNYSFIDEGIKYIWLMKFNKGYIYAGTNNGLIVFDVGKENLTYEIYKTKEGIRDIAFRNRGKKTEVFIGGENGHIYKLVEKKVIVFYTIRNIIKAKRTINVIKVIGNKLYIGINREKYSLVIIDTYKKIVLKIKNSEYVKDIVLLNEKKKNFILLITAKGLKFYFRNKKKHIIDYACKLFTYMRVFSTEEIENEFCEFSTLSFFRAIKYTNNIGIDFIIIGGEYGLMLLVHYNNDVDDYKLFPQGKFHNSMNLTDRFITFIKRPFVEKAYRAKFDFKNDMNLWLMKESEYSPIFFGVAIRHIRAIYYDEQYDKLWAGSNLGDIYRIPMHSYNLK